MVLVQKQEQCMIRSLRHYTPRNTFSACLADPCHSLLQLRIHDWDLQLIPSRIRTMAGSTINNT